MKLGTRGSLLAITQSRLVARAIEERVPQERVEEVQILTSGDKMKAVPFTEGGVKGLFVKELEESLLRGDIDFAVHSLKDMPAELPTGLEIVAYGKKEDRRDCLVSMKGYDLERLPKGAKVGTSSLRRQVQILAARSDLNVETIRGNLDTRLRKLKEGNYDAIIVAMAGIERLYQGRLPDGLSLYKIPFSLMLPCVGQGILAIEIRSDRKDLKEKLDFLNEKNFEIEARASRTFLKELGGSCRLPMAALGEVSGETLTLDGMIASPKGGEILRDKVSGNSSSPEQVGKSLAEKFLNTEKGRRVLEEIRNSG